MPTLYPLWAGAESRNLRGLRLSHFLGLTILVALISCGCCGLHSGDRYSPYATQSRCGFSHERPEQRDDKSVPTLSAPRNSSSVGGQSLPPSSARKALPVPGYSVMDDAGARAKGLPVGDVLERKAF